MMKNVVYFILKALFVVKIIIFFPFFGYVGNQLDKKLRLVSEFAMLYTGKQKVTILMLPNISRSKNNQAMKFGQLIE